MRTDASQEERQQLLNRILASREFAHAHILKRILGYLVQRAADPSQPAPKEYEIAVQAMGRPERFDPRTDPIVRVSVASIRDRLLAYFAGEGSQEQLQLSIPKGQYAVVFTPAGAARRDACEPLQDRPLVRLWKPYLTGQAGNIIVYTEPLFFRDDEGRYFRDWYVNDLVNGPAQLRTRLPLDKAAPLHPSYHYLSTGEVHCMLSLSRMFHERGAPLDTRNSRISSWNELRDANLILLGSPRTNTFLSTLQGEECFVVHADRIENRAPAENEQACYHGRRYLDGKLMRMSEYALITRRPGVSPDCAVTMIAANHGRAIEGAGHFLTIEERVQSVIELMGLRPSDEMPPHFQLLMQVETIDVDDEVARVQCVAHRVYSRSA